MCAWFRDLYRSIVGFCTSLSLTLFVLRFLHSLSQDGCFPFPGLIPIVHTYLDLIKCDQQTRAVVNKYMALIEKRAKGRCLCGLDPF